MEYLKIVLRSDLCAGNGESIGNAIDTDVCMDAAGLPYIPGRRLKGCLKQAAFDIEKMSVDEKKEEAKQEHRKIQEKICKLFGDAYGNEGCLFVQDAAMRGAEEIREFLTKKIPSDERGIDGCKGLIPEAVKRMAHCANVERIFSTVRGQTKLKDGVKVDNTLRFTRVIGHYDPFALENGKELEFYAPIYLNTDEPELKQFFCDCCRAARHIGTSRNRGLGNVKITVWSGDPGSKRYEVPENIMKKLENLQYEDKVKISYHILLDAPVTLPGCSELNTAIPARSVIGCLAGNYLRTGDAEDEKFSSLFQNGDVRWSDLTPVIGGTISDPVPMMFVKLKNDNERMINHLVQTTEGWKKLKPKTMDGSFAAFCTAKDNCEGGYVVVEPPIHTVYHHAVNGTVQDQTASSTSSGNTGRLLYMQESIDAGVVYGGTVICSPNMAEDIITLLCEADLRFGRSRSAQYAVCSLKEIANLEPFKEERIRTEKGENVYVILKSDLALQKDGIFITDAGEVRRILSEKAGLNDTIPEGRLDYCRYHTIGGYQSTWQLQKPHVPVVRAGSVYCFEAAGSDIPAIVQAGSFQQEGMGMCYIVPEKEMKEAVQVREGRIDRAEPQKSEEYIRDVYIKLLVSSGLEKMREYALDFKLPNEKIPVGRLRLMLSEAKEYKDLLRMIGTIKESDISSENEVSRKQISEKLVKSIYTEPGEDKISLNKILGADEDLCKEIEYFSEAEKALLENWKLPLEIILHRQHYKKER